MLTTAQVLAFLATAVLLTATPGPDNLMVLGMGMSRGRRAGMAFGLGCLSHTLLAVVGVSALAAASPLAFLPQFVVASQGRVEWQLGLLGALFTAQAALLFGLLGYFSGSIGTWLNRRPLVGPWLDRLAGTVFMGLGLRMIVAR